MILIILSKNTLKTEGVLPGDFFGVISYVLAPAALVLAGIMWVRGLQNRERIQSQKGIGGFWTLIGIAAAAVISVLHPADDRIYYAGVLLVGITMIMTLLDVVLRYNQLATRPLPQFEYRGGDDRA